MKMEKMAKNRVCGRGAFASVLRAFAVALALACAVTCAGLFAPVAYGADVGLQAAGPQAVDYDTSWYDGKESPYTIENVKQLKGLAYLVNSGKDSFEGDVIKLEWSSCVLGGNVGRADRQRRAPFPRCLRW